MRKYLKSQILEIAATLNKANDILKKSLEKDNRDQANTLLAEEQETAIHIGNIIEETEGEGTEAVRLLEEYCELIWECCEAESKEGKLRLLKNLNKKLIQAENAIKDIKEKYDIVFLPYKASMWDSLESVWLAAREDESCNCYVIPIPYFDKNPDGTCSTMHYEGNQFPDYVQITNYDDYDIKTKHPEVIYFHNPYDQYNFVTSVHPAFYSSELKKYTDMLVYIPYFVSIGDVQEHLCQAAGVYNADRVVVQSEKVKETYERVFMSAMGENQRNLEEKTGKCDRQYWKALKMMANKKFLTLGSPKFDKVISTKREDVNIPEEWEKVIYKRDGKRRKVIFYNTSIAALLNNGYNVIDKVKDTLTVFRENEEVALLWRPHPLNETTLGTMRPALLNDYQHIVNKFQQDGWGIYDDTADLNRAIAISDAYYGDWSSVVALYKLTGKPIMIQNVEVLSE